ncbi:DUF421 domain-containing protein [Bacillus piscicola]|uniref:DUF421 domain-containing protein n=1 Tax=Bacillus piscicola TaxID=1632684 RepID=UPI001F09702F
MDIVTIAFRTVIIYFFLLLTLRMMGKREIGDISVLDFVVSIMFAELAVISIEDTKEPLIKTVIPIVILLMIQVTLAFLSLKSERVRHLLDGKPTFLIKNGQIDEKAMKKQRYNFDDLLTQIRQQNVKDISDVEFAVLEPSGDLSVFEKEEGEQTFFPLPLIIDGKVQADHLQKAKKDELWLRRELRKAGIMHIHDISYCALHGDGVLYIDLHDE